MKRNDDHEIQRSSARNSLEELIFETRDSIPTADNSDASFVNAKLFRNFIDKVEKWLYNKGENCKLETYLLIRQEIEDFEMIKKIKRIDREFLEDYNMLVAKMNSIAEIACSDNIWNLLNCNTAVNLKEEIKCIWYWWRGNKCFVFYWDLKKWLYII